MNVTEKPLRVIHIVHGKANPESENGISRVVYYLNKYEKIHGVQSQIWAIVDGVREHFTHRRDEHVVVECFPRLRWPWGNRDIVQALLAQKGKIDLVHFHLIWFYDKNIIADALHRAAIPYIVTTHGTYTTNHAYTGKRRIARWLYELDYLNKATEIHTVNREEGTGLQKYGYRGRSFVAYNGIADDEVPVVRRSDFFAGKPYANKIKLAWVGVLRDDKNLVSLIRAVSMLPPAVRDCVAIICVGPDYRGNAQRYAALAAELGCAVNFDFVGPLYGQAKYDAIQSADAYVMPSFTEGFSMSILDAMACGKPCLLTAGCSMNYFHDKGFFVRCEPYAEDLARGLEQLLARRADWSLMGARAQELVASKFNWDAISREMISNYRRVARKAEHVG
jgi:glycosyltransferase involved in cell wall biosynthesis